MRIALLGNYLPDRQESMLRYAAMMLEGLRERGHEVTLALPKAILNGGARSSTGARKWLGYLDKYFLGRGDLVQAARRADVVHICDHSNAVYVPAAPGVPYVVTCHDLLAVRGALGEDTDCPATAAGRLLQQRILAGLQRAQAVACVSAATLRDANRLMEHYRGELVVAPNALNFPYRKLAIQTVRDRIGSLAAMQGVDQYLLHVGSNLRRKNRETILRAVAGIATEWTGKVVFAGQALNSELAALARELGVRERIVEVVGPDNEQLEALYNGALALLFPSRFEGFGWPIIEAQACGCPVICSDRDPFPEVSGTGALFCGSDDDVAFGRAIIALASQPESRAELARRGMLNAALYGRPAMIDRFVALYERVADSV